MSRDQFRPSMQLAIEPDVWRLILTKGEELRVLTHAYAVEGGGYVFTLLMEGNPRFEVEVLRIPAHLVASIED